MARAVQSVRPPHHPDELQGLLADSSDNERGEPYSNPPCWKWKMGGRKRKCKAGCEWEALEGITLFGFDLFTHNNADSDAAPLDIPSSKKSPIPKALKRRRRRRGKGAGEEGEEGDEEAGVAGDGAEFEGFSREWVDWRCFVGVSSSVSLSIPAIEGRFSALCICPSSSKTMKRRIWTELSTRGRGS